MTDPLDKPFWENYPDKNTDIISGIDYFQFLEEAVKDIRSIIDLNFISHQDKLKLLHEIAEQALNVKKGDLKMSIYLGVHNDFQWRNR